MSGLLLWLVARQLRWEDLAGAFARLDASTVLVATALIAVDRVIVVHKWWMLLIARGLQVPWLYALRLYLASNFLGLLLPSTIGADAIRIGVLARRLGRTEEVIASVLVERVLGMIVLVLLAALGGGLLWAFAFDLPAGLGVGLLAAALGLAAVAIAAVVGSLALSSEALDAKLGSRAGAWTAAAVERLRAGAAALRGYAERPQTIGAFVALTALVCIVESTLAWAISRGVGLSVHFLVFVGLVPVVLLAVRLPISIAGFGVYEGGFTWFLTQAGVAAPEAFAVGALVHVFSLASVLPGALFVGASAEGGWSRRARVDR